MRIKILRLIVVLSFLLVIFRLAYIQISQGSYYYNLSRNNRIRVVSLEGERGRIFDRNGMILADNRRSLNVLVVPQELKKTEALFDFLAQTLGADKEVLMKLFRTRSLGPFAPVVVAEDVSREKAIVVEENKFRFPGLLIDENFRRLYPQREAAGHLIGYVRKISPQKLERLRDYGYTPQSVVGVTGVEEFYDRYLRGRRGGVQIEVNSRGQQVRLLSLKESQKGQDLTLTVDYRIQQTATELLAGRAGAVVMMDMSNGEILGLVSSPGYDPNIFIDNEKTVIQNIFSNALSPLLNRVVNAEYHPGSVFKIPVALCALDSKAINPHTTFHCPGIFNVGGRPFRCAHTHGNQDLVQGIARSCNIYFYHAGLLLGSDIIRQYAKLFGFGEVTGIDLPAESKGFIPSRLQRRKDDHKNWFDGDTLNLSIGQGDVMATPLQLTRLMSIVAQKGRDVRPHVIKALGPFGKSPENSSAAEQEIDPSDETLYDSSLETPPLSPGRFLQGMVHVNDSKIFDPVQFGLGQVVSDSSGTAHILNIPGLSVLGKTGTAQTTPTRDAHSWFAGYVVSPKMKIAFCVFLEHGGSSYNACVVARDLLLRIQAEGIL